MHGWDLFNSLSLNTFISQCYNALVRHGRESTIIQEVCEGSFFPYFCLAVLQSCFGFLVVFLIDVLCICEGHLFSSVHLFQENWLITSRRIQLFYLELLH